MTPAGLEPTVTDVYLTTHNTHNRQTCMLPVGLEPTVTDKREPADPRLGPRGHWDRSKGHTAPQQSHTGWPGFEPDPQRFEFDDTIVHLGSA